MQRYCSWCYEYSRHLLTEKSVLSRNRYVCAGCSNHTVECRLCQNMAKGPLRERDRKKIDGFVPAKRSQWSDELCAEHDGTISSFPALTMKLPDVTAYDQLFQRSATNVVRAAKYAGYGAAGIITVVGVAASGGIGAGPVAAAAGKLGLLGAAGTGTAISSLSGAALTSASLAAIGGSVATGTAVVSATGLALGGLRGGLIASRYHSDDESFAIRSLTDTESSNRTIFVNGFLKQKDESFDDWRSVQTSFDKAQALYGVNWCSKSRMDLTNKLAGGVSSDLALRLFIDIAEKGGKAAAKKFNLLALAASVVDLLDNPWHTSMVRAAQAGIQLAEAISRTTDKSYTLVGHSLGCRVIYYALEALGTKSNRFINNVVLLGGAVGRNDDEGWSKAVAAVSGRLFNCYSSNDLVLGKLYAVANAGLSDPIGVRPITYESTKIRNIDFSDIVDSHNGWKPKYAEVVHRIRATGA